MGNIMVYKKYSDVIIVVVYIKYIYEKMAQS